MKKILLAGIVFLSFGGLAQAASVSAAKGHIDSGFNNSRLDFDLVFGGKMQGLERVPGFLISAQARDGSLLRQSIMDIAASRSMHFEDLRALRLAMSNRGGEFGRDRNPSTAVTPIPASAWLFLSGLGLLGWLRMRGAERS